MANQAFNSIQEIAKGGKAVDQFIVGLCYYNGDGVEEDKKEAFKWFIKAANQGLVDAQFKIGLCYFTGDGVEKNKREAFNWWMKAAEQGNVDAQFYVGASYLFGWGVEKDEKKAATCFMEAAKKGSVNALAMVGYCYKEGLGVEKDKKKAATWFKKAEEQNDVKNKKTAEQDNIKVQNEDLYMEKYMQRIERCIQETTRQEISKIKEDDDTNIKAKENQDFSKVFIVHGRDELKHKIARLLQDQNIEAIILDEQPNGGAETIIKKFEENSNVCAAICLFTADDIGKLQDKYSEKEKTQNDYRPRARQNVVFETGFFMAKLGRKNVIIIADPEIEFPSDMGDILYTNSGEWRIDMLSELDNMGYGIDLNKLKKRKLCKN